MLDHYSWKSEMMDSFGFLIEGWVELLLNESELDRAVLPSMLFHST